MKSDGTVLHTFTDGFAQATAVAVDAAGNIYVVDNINYAVVVLSPTGRLLHSFTQANGLYVPSGVAVDAAGNVYVADTYQHAVVKFAAIKSCGLSSSSSSSSLPPVLPFQLQSSTSSSVPSSPKSASTASLCLLFYSLPGNPDFPWSSAVQLTVQYVTATVTTSTGSAVLVVSGSGTRTFVHQQVRPFRHRRRHGAVSRLFICRHQQQPAVPHSALPFDASGITLQLSVNQTLPGHGPLVSYGQLRYYLQTAVLVNTTNTTATYITEDASSRIDPTGSAFLSSVPGFHNITLGGGNANIGAVKYATCQAPITFANGQRAPINPSFANGGKTIQYNYFVSDGATYSITTNLTLTTDGAMANAVDALGNQYQNIIGVTGTRVYRYLPTNQIVSSTVSGLSSHYATADQRFYPFALLGSGAGIYTINTAPFVDYDGIEFNISPAAPAAGLPPGQGTQYTATSVYTESRELSPVLVDGYLYPSSGLQVSGVGTGVPLQSLQQQQYARLTSS